MCLIAYVPPGKALSREVFNKAYAVNSDGIGIMSAKGIEKFFGSKTLKRARRYAEDLAKEGLGHAIHFRYATHGARNLALCHPFKLPSTTDIWLMHNGVIGSTAQDARDDASDTLLYVNKLTDAPPSHETLDYWNNVCGEIGSYNKAVVMYPGGHFIILNKDKGFEHEGLWYSNRYSLPDSIRGDDSYFVPTRLRSNLYDSYVTGGYKPLGHGSNTDGPFGHSIYWSYQNQAYGFWEGMHFITLTVERRPEKLPTAITPPPVLDTLNRCPRCNRPMHKTPYHLECMCEPLTVAEFLARRSHASGPTLDTEELTPIAKAHDGMCEHGETSWENCRECINRLEQGDDCSLPKDNGGYPPDSIIYLPKWSHKR